MQTLTKTTLKSTSERDALMADLETLWSKLDEIWGNFVPQDWKAKHGKDWTMADLPYHLSYFDRDMVAGAILRGPDVPLPDQNVLSGSAAVDAWNAPYFAESRVTRTAEGSLAQMRASRHLLRRLVASRDDDDMQRQVFVGLLGWATVYRSVELCYAHTWRHFLELKLLVKRDTPTLSPEQTHRALNSLLRSFPAAIDRLAAEALGRPFVLVMQFTGPGGGAWSLRIENGAATVREENAPSANLTITQSPETFVRTMAQMHNPVIAMLTRKMKVRGIAEMGTFARLFPLTAKE